MKKRVFPWLLALSLICSLLVPSAQAVTPVNQQVITSTTVSGAIDQLEAAYGFTITNNCSVTLDELKHIESAINLISPDFFREVLSYYKTEYGITMKLLLSPYKGQDYTGMTSPVISSYHASSLTVELVDCAGYYTTSGLDTDIIVHEFTHVIHFAATCKNGGTDPFAAAFQTINNGILYQEQFAAQSGVTSRDWSRYVSALGSNLYTYFISEYAMTDSYEDLSCLMQTIADSSVDSASLLLTNAPLLAKYQTAIAVFSKYFSKAYASPLLQVFPSDWAQDEWSAASSAGLIPDALTTDYRTNITRSEFCDLMIQLLKTVWGSSYDSHIAALNLNAVSYTDTDSQNVLTLTALGVINGYGGGIFDPNGSITREQAAKMLVLTAETVSPQLFSGSIGTVFSDSGSFSSWAASYISKASAGGIMNGTSASVFSPSGGYTVEQSIVTAYRLYELLA